MSDNFECFLDRFTGKLKFVVYIEDRTEVYALSYEDSQEHELVMLGKAELGKVFPSFVYDHKFEVLTDLLIIDSEEYVKQIKAEPCNIKHWEPFINVAKDICRTKDVHPFYFSLLQSIVNAYKSRFHDSNGFLLPDDYFVRLGESYVELRNKCLEHMELFDTSRKEQDVDVRGYVQRSRLLEHSLVLGYKFDADKDNATVKFVLHPKTPEDIWAFLLPKYIDANLKFKRCENCMRYFSTSMVNRSKYCDHFDPKLGRSCRQQMPKVKIQMKTESDPAHWLYNRAYKTMYFRVSSGKMSKELYKAWSKEARAKRDECSAGKISPEDYSAWLCDNGLHIDYLKGI